MIPREDGREQYDAICKELGCENYALEYLEGCYLHHLKLIFDNPPSKGYCVVEDCKDVVFRGPLFCKAHYALYG